MNNNSTKSNQKVLSLSYNIYIGLHNYSSTVGLGRKFVLAVQREMNNNSTKSK